MGPRGRSSANCRQISGGGSLRFGNLGQYRMANGLNTGPGRRRQVHKRGDVQLDRGHVRRQVPFRGESATAADASVVHRTSTGRPASRGTREHPPGRETGLMNAAGVGKIVRVTSAVVTGAIALSG